MFSIEMNRHTEPDDEWGTITLGGDQYWADPVLANRKFRGVLNFVRSNIRANWDLRLVRSSTPINTVRTRSHHKIQYPIMPFPSSRDPNNMPAPDERQKGQTQGYA